MFMFDTESERALVTSLVWGQKDSPVSDVQEKKSDAAYQFFAAQIMDQLNNCWCLLLHLSLLYKIVKTCINTNPSNVHNMVAKIKFQ